MYVDCMSSCSDCSSLMLLFVEHVFSECTCVIHVSIVNGSVIAECAIAEKYRCRMISVCSE